MNIAALTLFCFVACITPGPNNTLLMSTGAQFGLRKALPAVAGVLGGFLVMVAAVGFGLGALLSAAPWIFQVLQPIAVLYLLYLAYHIATAPPAVPAERVASARATLGFSKMAMFQLINPKSWIMAISATSAFATAGPDYAWQVLVIVGIYTLVGLPSAISWAALGSLAGRMLRTERQVRIFNIVLALALVASLIPIVIEILTEWTGG